MLIFPPLCPPGHERYYNKYINVKKGGIGGITMLLAGYVVLSYIWEYDHISKKTLISRLCSAFVCNSLPHSFLRLLFQNTIAGGSITKALQQPSDLQGSNFEALCSPCSFYSQLHVQYVTVNDQ